MSDGALEDMNATPLGKLPPPALQTKQGQVPVEAPSYRDLLSEMESSARQPQQLQQGPLPPPPPPPPPMPQYAPQQYSPPPPQQYSPPPPQQYGPDPYATAAPYYSPYPDPPPLQPAAPAESTMQRLLRANKAALVVLGLVLLTLLVVVPRLSRMPRFIALDGQFTLTGKVAASAIAAVAYRLVMLVV